jgi:hypothetical protein
MAFFATCNDGRRAVLLPLNSLSIRNATTTYAPMRVTRKTSSNQGRSVAEKGTSCVIRGDAISAATRGGCRGSGPERQRMTRSRLPRSRAMRGDRGLSAPPRGAIRPRPARRRLLGARGPQARVTINWYRRHLGARKRLLRVPQDALPRHAPNSGQATTAKMRSPHDQDVPSWPPTTSPTSHVSSAS